MQSPTEFLEQHRPAGGRRSGKRDVIVSTFLGRDGHLAADELVDLVRAGDARISRRSGRGGCESECEERRSNERS